MKPKALAFAALLMASVVFAAGCVEQGSVTLPDGSVQKADGTIIKPNGVRVLPDGTMVAPEGSPAGIIVNEDGTVVKPDGTMVKPDGTMVLSDGTTIEPESSAAAPDSSSYSGAVLAGTSAQLIDFNKADYDSAVASDKLVVLYFYATWCPICRAELPELYGAFNELQRGDVIGFRVNFNDGDTDADEMALAQQYQVPYQHTKVFIKNGQQVLKAPDSWNKGRYLSEISNYAG
jgi:thiol-disulfide isomerase/thioredoxin